MTLAIGRGVRVEMDFGSGTSKAITGITNANPGVASFTGIGFVDGTVGYLATATGMEAIEGMAFTVSNPATGTFELENFSTFGVGTFTAGTFIPVTAWRTLATATEYNFSGGEADPLDSTVLLDLGKKSEPGLNGTQTCTISIRSETDYSQALSTIEGAARTGQARIFRITLRDGATRVFRGVPSMPTESLSTSALGVGGFSVALIGFFTRGSATP